MTDRVWMPFWGALALASACDNGDVEVGTPGMVNRVSLSADQTVLQVGQTAQLTVIAGIGTGVVSQTGPSHFESSNPTVLTVDASGKVSALGQGIANVKATLDSVESKPLTFQVQAVPAEQESPEQEPDTSLGKALESLKGIRSGSGPGALPSSGGNGAGEVKDRRAVSIGNLSIDTPGLDVGIVSAFLERLKGRFALCLQRARVETINVHVSVGGSGRVYGARASNGDERAHRCLTSTIERSRIDGWGGGINGFGFTIR